MAIVIGKLIEQTFCKAGLAVYRLRIHGGDYTTAVYRGSNPPKAWKTIEYILFGQWHKHPIHGKQFTLDRVERSKIAKQKKLMADTRRLTSELPEPGELKEPVEGL